MAIVSDVIPVARRGTATGTIMTAFSLAAIAGVPTGVLLGARFGWASPFLLLVALTTVIWLAGARLVPSLAEHLQHKPAALPQVLPDLWRLLSAPSHLKAFALTFMMMVAHMLVIPFVSPMLVANHGVAPAQLSWIYMAGGAATFFTSRAVGRMADRYGKHHVFRFAALVSIFPVLLITHLPALPFTVVVPLFACFMVALNARMVPMQALLTTVPEPARRGAFLSANSALQALGTGCGAWFGGLRLSSSPGGKLLGYGKVGWCAAALALVGLWWVGRVKSYGPVAAQTSPSSANGFDAIDHGDERKNRTFSGRTSASVEGAQRG
jgi:MFS transporter, DHA1 family, inner membrane transport protein